MAQPPTNAQKVTAELAKYPRLDPRAVLAIAAHEGLSGGIGDQGTSFGAFQLHKGGALPSSVPLSQANEWAWSPQGIDYALNHIAQVAGGLHGLAAISAISRRFERPANPAAEIADAARHYGLTVPGGSSTSFATLPGGSPSSLSAGAPVPAASALQKQPLIGSPLAALVASTNQSLGLGGSPLLMQLLAQKAAR